MSTSTLIGQLPLLSSKKVLTFLAVLTLMLGITGSGLIMTVLFYLILVAWSFLLTYRLVILSGGTIIVTVPKETPAPTQAAALNHPDLFVENVRVQERPPATPVVPAQSAVFADSVPANLPVVGYNNLPSTYEEAVATVGQPEGGLAYELEEQAHRARVLLSADALRHFLATVPDNLTPSDVLASVITTAKQRYPSEDGWVVLNEERMSEVCVQCLTSAFPASSNEAPYAPTIVPEGTGSLAEMIASSNVGAAFALIGHRPMFALSDAVADFDALYRQRKGEAAHVSTLLIESTKDLSDDILRQVMTALTSALDGMYNDEAEAVKTAIMKAVKVRG